MIFPLYVRHSLAPSTVFFVFVVFFVFNSTQRRSSSGDLVPGLQAESAARRASGKNVRLMYTIGCIGTQLWDAFARDVAASRVLPVCTKGMRNYMLPLRVKLSGGGVDHECLGQGSR